MSDFLTARMCWACQTNKPAPEFSEGSSKCRACTYRTIYAQREGLRPKRPSEPPISTCPFCSKEHGDSQGLIAHLAESHRAKNGGILGIDSVPCQICGAARKDMPGHLKKRHELTTEAYLERYPKALLHPYGSSALGGGRAQAGERRVYMAQRQRESGLKCPHCGLSPIEMDYHLRRWHGQDLDLALYAGHSKFLEILELRGPEDIQMALV